MNSETEAPQTESRANGGSRDWRAIRRVLVVLLVTGLALVGGCLSGAGYGGNHAPDFSFFGAPGYEGSGLMAGVVSAFTVLVVSALALGLFRHKSVAALTIIGMFFGILFGAPILFPIIAPSEELFALTYFGSILVGALVGTALGFVAIGSQRKRPSDRHS